MGYNPCMSLPDAKVAISLETTKAIRVKRKNQREEKHNFWRCRWLKKPSHEVGHYRRNCLPSGSSHSGATAARLGFLSHDAPPKIMPKTKARTRNESSLHTISVWCVSLLLGRVAPLQSSPPLRLMGAKVTRKIQLFFIISK